MKTRIDAEKAVHWMFTATTIVFLLTGYGITDYGAVEAITLGLLSRSLSLRVHTSIGPLFIALLASHIYLALRRRASTEKAA